MIRATLTTLGKRVLHTAFVPPVTDPVLVSTTIAREHGVFKSANRTTAGTTNIVTAPSGGGLVLTDLILTTDRVVNATATIRFSDGTNTVNIAAAAVNDAPANLAMGIQGGWRGWANASLQLVTVNSVDATVTVGYYKFLNALPFAEWDALR